MKLSNIKKGYAEFEWTFEDHTYYGAVETKSFVVKTDFEKDEIIYTERWVPYLSYSKHLTFRWVPYLSYSKHLTFPRSVRIGRLTGYKTRKEALEAAKAYICETEVYTNEARS